MKKRKAKLPTIETPKGFNNKSNNQRGCCGQNACTTFDKENQPTVTIHNSDEDELRLRLFAHIRLK
jgi:hypothetical protein